MDLADVPGEAVERPGRCQWHHPPGVCHVHRNALPPGQIDRLAHRHPGIITQCNPSLSRCPATAGAELIGQPHRCPAPPRHALRGFRRPLGNRPGRAPVARLRQNLRKDGGHYWHMPRSSPTSVTARSSASHPSGGSLPAKRSRLPRRSTRRCADHDHQPHGKPELPQRAHFQTGTSSTPGCSAPCPCRSTSSFRQLRRPAGRHHRGQGRPHLRQPLRRPLLVREKGFRAIARPEGRPTMVVITGRQPGPGGSATCSRHAAGLQRRP